MIGHAKHGLTAVPFYLLFHLPGILFSRHTCYLLLTSSRSLLKSRFIREPFADHLIESNTPLSRPSILCSPYYAKFFSISLITICYLSIHPSIHPLIQSLSTRLFLKDKDFV